MQYLRLPHVAVFGPQEMKSRNVGPTNNYNGSRITERILYSLEISWRPNKQSIGSESCSQRLWEPIHNVRGGSRSGIVPGMHADGCIFDRRAGLTNLDMTSMSALYSVEGWRRLLSPDRSLLMLSLLQDRKQADRSPLGCHGSESEAIVVPFIDGKALDLLCGPLRVRTLNWDEACS